MKGTTIISTIICLMFLSANYLTADTYPNIPPRFKKQQKPVYPKEAIIAQKEGKVILEATIDVNGIAKNIKALTQLGFEFEEAAIESLKKSTFHPAIRQGKPASSVVRIPYEFKLGPPTRQMVLIPAGEFQMGSTHGSLDEKPAHTVHLDAFYIDKYEVTNIQFKAFVNANPQWQKDNIPPKFHDGYYLADWVGNDYPIGKNNHPVVYVSWYAAMAYAKWAEKRLPTEAEWEKAARGGLIGKKYPWGDKIDSTNANYYDGTDKEVTPVASFPANGYGLYDMAGNVREWCLDTYNENFYKSSPRENPIAGAESVDYVLKNFLDSKNGQVIRGGSWFDDAQLLHISNRNWRKPTATNPNEGFRCVKSGNPVPLEK